MSSETYTCLGLMFTNQTNMVDLQDALDFKLRNISIIELKQDLSHRVFPIGMIIISNDDKKLCVVTSNGISQKLVDISKCLKDTRGE